MASENNRDGEPDVELVGELSSLPPEDRAFVDFWQRPNWELFGLRRRKLIGRERRKVLVIGDDTLRPLAITALLHPWSTGCLQVTFYRVDPDLYFFRTQGGCITWEDTLYGPFQFSGEGGDWRPASLRGKTEWEIGPSLPSIQVILLRQETDRSLEALSTHLGSSSESVHAAVSWIEAAVKAERDLADQWITKTAAVVREEMQECPDCHTRECKCSLSQAVQSALRKERDELARWIFDGADGLAGPEKRHYLAEAIRARTERRKDK